MLINVLNSQANRRLEHHQNRTPTLQVMIQMVFFQGRGQLDIPFGLESTLYVGLLLIQVWNADLLFAGTCLAFVYGTFSFVSGLDL